MVTLVQAYNNATTTWNGDITHVSTFDACLDLFYQIGASRGKDVSGLFKKALNQDEELATRILLWSRDAREGAGERQTFKDLIKHVSAPVVERVIPMIPELGRWDDLLVFLNTPFERQAVGVIAAGLNRGNGLCAKWMPRQGEQAKRIRKVLEIPTPKMWRQLVVSMSDTVEQRMCAKQWDEIDFEKVPSLAAIRYTKAFERNAPQTYGKYKAALEKGEAKINAGAVYPYDVVKGTRYGVSSVAQAQWDSLPNYMEGVDERILPMIDVSGSMSCKAGGHFSKSDTTCMDVAVSLGLYVAQRNVGSFKNVVMTFHESPALYEVDEKLKPALDKIYRLPWGMSTNIDKAIQSILDRAVKYKVPENEMPTKLLIMSDMQFDYCVRGGTAFERFKQAYKDAGYTMPQIVFWNINSKAGNCPVTKNDHGVALVSGFSPSILKSLVRGDLDPVKVMLDTVMIDRYNYAA